MVDRQEIIRIFKASPTPTSIVSANDPDYSFVQMNDAYLEMTGREEANLIGRSIFEAFPANPDEEKPTGVDRLRESFQRVLRTKKTDKMDAVRYDITLKDGTYSEFYWRIENAPVFDDQGCVEFIINSATNITEQKLNEREYELILNSAEDSFVLIDRDRKILNFNDAYAEKTQDIFDRKPEVGMSIMEFALPERVDKINDILKKVFNGGIVKADLCMRNTDGKNRHFYTIYRPASLQNGYIYGALFSVYEKTEEYHAKKELERKEARFRALVETGNDVLLILSPDAKPTYISPSIQNVLGYSQEEAYKRDLMEIVHPEDIPIIVSELEKCLDKPGEPMEVTPARMRHKDGRYRWFEGTITNMMHDPAINGIVDIFRDITDRVAYQEAIEESKEKYERLIQTIDGVVWEAEPDNLHVTYMSPQSLRILGHDPDVWASTIDFWKDHIHPDDRNETYAKFEELTKIGQNHELEYRFQKGNGEYIWVRDVVTVITDNEKPEIIRGVIIDINKEKQLKIELDKVYEMASIGNWEVDLVNDQLYWSDVVKKTFEVDPDFKPDLKTAIEFYPEGENREAIQEAVNRAINEGVSYEIELQIATAKGNIKWIRNIGNPEFKNGTCIRVHGSTQDITKRKEAELDLKRSHESLIERIKEQQCLYDITKLNDRNLTIPQLLEKAVNIIPRAMLFDEFAQARITWNDQHFDSKKFTRLNEYITISEDENSKSKNDLLIRVGYPNVPDAPKELKILEEEKVLLKAIGYQLNQKIDQILKRRQIREAEQKFRNVVEHSTNMFYQHDLNGVLEYVSPQSEVFLGYSPEEARKCWTDFVTDHPLNKKGEELTKKAIETGKIQEPYELQLITRDNRIIWVEVNEAPLIKDHKVVGIVGSLTDITDRKKYEKQLKQSLERYDYVSKASRDAIYDWDITNDNIHWGEGFTSLFGHKSGTERYPIRKWEKLLHSGDLEETRRDLIFTLEDTSMNKWACEYRIKKAKGGYAYVEENGYIIRNEDGKAIRMIGALKDITDQKQNEEALKASLSEKETLLAEIHHRVKNNLAVVSGMMQLQAFESDNDDLQEKLYDSVVRIKTMATVHELLYQSNSFSKLEFSDTLKKLVENVSETLQPGNAIALDIHCDPITLNINQAIPASLIVNEVITNAYKHAFKDQDTGEIAFSVKEENDHVSIQISDNGTGIPEGQLQRSGSLGIHLINVLCDQINGSSEYKNTGKGTTFILRFEKQETKKGIGNAALV